MRAKLFILSISLFALMAYFGTGWCGNITIDGNSEDWADLPILVEAENNLLDYFPEEVGAAISDRVDVKQVKAFIDVEEDVFYFFIRFWGGPVWPNNAYGPVYYNNNVVVRHRGYYHLMLDLDNDRDTGWNNHWYEGHYTPLGYYASQHEPQTKNIGVECVIDLEIDSYWTPPAGNGRVKYVAYGGADYHGYNGETGPFDIGEFSWFYVKNPKPEDMAQFVGNTINWYDQEEYWAGHAFGYDFLEYGVSLDAFRTYWESQGEDYLKPGDKIKIAAFIETPIDDWGVDVSPGGKMTIPEAGSGELGKIAAGSEGVTLPSEFSLAQSYPNPFNPETNIRFQLPEASSVTITVYNTIGQAIRTLVESQYEAGFHSVRWNGKDQNGSDVSSGIYIYKIQAGNFTDMKKMTLVR
jgi:hypothetical protein